MLITSYSLLGKALLGRYLDDEVVINLGQLVYEIVSVD